MPRYKTAYELGLDALDLKLCLEMEMEQADYDGSRQTHAETKQRNERIAEKEMPDDAQS